MTKNEILDDLREKILSEEYTQGDSLIERELCEYYEISRTPIREILWRLVLDGIVEQRPARGFFVRKLGWEQIFDVFQTREAIEGMAVRLACQRRETGFLRDLEILQHKLESLPEDQVAEEGPRYGRTLHAMFIDASANTLLKEIYQKVSFLARLTSNIARHSSSIEGVSRNFHLLIIQAVLDQDADKSEQLMREHMRITCRDIIDTFYPQVFLGKAGGIEASGKQ